MVAMVPDVFRLYTKPATPEEKQEAQYIVKWRGDPNRDKALVVNFVRDVVTQLEPILLKYVVPHDYQPELRFRTPFGIPYLDGRLTAVDLIGGIDIVVRLRSPMELNGVRLETGDFAFYDLKATANKDYIPKTLGQAIFYDISGGYYFGMPEQPKAFGFIAPVLEQKIHWTTVAEIDRTVMIDRIIRFAHGQWRREWDPKVGSQCYNCDVRHACEAWKVDVEENSAGKHRASFEVAAKRRAVHRVDGSSK